MGKVMTNAMIDGGLDKIATCTTMTVCAGQPTSYADIAARALATTTLTAGDFTIANGDVSGRKITVAAQAGLTVDTAGTADHVTIDDGVDYVITTATSQALVSGTVSVPAYDSEISDPV